jgi:Rv2632c-like
MAGKGVTMERTATWHIEVFLFEEGDRTRAEAVLRTSAGTELRHEGVARRNPRDTEVPEIGEELATARALSGLAHDLFEATVADIEENVQERVQLDT